MICFRDRTYCGSENCKGKCGRQLTDEVLDAAQRWWEGFKGDSTDGPPIALAQFCDEHGEVINYHKKETKKE